MANLRSNTSRQCLNQLLESEALATLLQALEDFQSTLGANGMFWLEFVTMVQLLLCFVRSSRTRNWSMHLHCLQNMLPWLAAYDCTNYSRYLPLYVMDMLRLPQTHPDVHAELQAGGFAVQRSSERPFTSIPHDQNIEVTINKDTTVSRGLIGKTLRHDTTNKWVWTAADRATYYQRSKDLCGMGPAVVAYHKDGIPARIQRDESSIQRPMETIDNLVNPFVHQEIITHIASGKYATPEIEKDLLEAQERGERAVTEFVSGRLDKEGDVSFYDRIPKLSLKTFASFTDRAKNNTQSSCEQETTAVFAQLYDIGEQARISRELLLSHELTSLPRSLADSYGAKHKGQKSDLLHILSGLADDSEVPAQITHVIDAMAVLQAIKAPAATYNELARQVFDRMVLGTTDHLTMP